MNDEAEYLGDGLYVDTVDGMVRLYASDGENVLNQVFLEDEVLASFQAWIERQGLGAP